MVLREEQADRLQVLVTQIDLLSTETDESGAEEILDELYLLITKLLDRFPNLDSDDES